MIFVKPQSALILAIIDAQMFLMLYKRPYAGVRGNVRPFLNLLVSALMLFNFLMNQSLSSNQLYDIYAPIRVIILLGITLAFNAY
jgi:hypothetical protein